MREGELADIETKFEHQVRRLAKHCASYKGAITSRSVTQLMINLVLFGVLVAGSMASVAYEMWVGVLLTIPAAGILVRLFIIQHDCGHGSFFKSKTTNEWVGRFISVFTITPYSYWRQAHAIHHATSGNLCRRGVGDIGILTVREYLELSVRKRIIYRLYRHPLILQLLGSPYHFFIDQRIPFGVPDSIKGGWQSIMALNVVLAVVYGLAIYFFGWKPVVIGFIPVVVMAAWIGGWLFYIQHQFENTYWVENENWNFQAAALYGSSYYDLPSILHWFTGNIGLHHIHHLCGTIPNYRLRDCLKSNPDLQKFSRITLLESLKCARLSLWDEDRRALVGFSHV